ncbi:MAG: hypothetical protein AAB738_00050 [Patescibacteria group bacterium]
MQNPERRILENLAIEQAYKKADKVLTRDAIHPDEFEDLYGAQNISQDNDYVAKMKAKFKEQEGAEEATAKKLATILEAIIFENAELSEWFGPNASTIKTSEFDDIKNGVDSVVEFEESKTSASHLALAMDATFSSETGGKFHRIKEEIESGELTKVKYFQSDHMSIRGELSKIPRVVVGVNAETVKALSETWLENPSSLKDHPIQFQILEEILMQLRVFKDYAKKIKKTDIGATYEKVIGIVEEILEEKKKLIKDTGERDSVFYDMESNLRHFSG